MHKGRLEALKSVIPIFLCYTFSFIFVGIYWNNHHHMLQAAHKVTGGILWANLHLLFCFSIIPFVTSWMGENHFAPVTVSVYGIVLLMSGVAFYSTWISGALYIQ